MVICDEEVAPSTDFEVACPSTEEEVSAAAPLVVGSVVEDVSAEDIDP